MTRRDLVLPRVLLATFALVALAGVPSVSSAGDMFSVFGVHEMSCGRFTKDALQDTANNALEWYIAGFLTGSSYARGREINVDVDGAFAFVSKYCAENPLDPAAKALFELDKELNARAKQQG